MRFGEAFLFWLKLGFISFGGPAGQIALMHDALVVRRKVISESRFLHALNFCMVLPGPEAQQLATYLGWLMHRTWGGLIAGGLFVLPSFFILVGISSLYVNYGHLPLVEGLFAGIKPAVLALVLFASYRMGHKTLKNAWLWIVAILSLLATSLLGLAFPWIILGALFIGLIGARIAPQFFVTQDAHSTEHTADAPLSLEPHHRFSPKTAFLVLIVGLIAWGLPMGWMAGILGSEHPLTVMGLFFSKAAMLTFGGAYAVLPYVFEASVHQYHWLTLPQMMDGLGLGETTPGPLIMVVTYVGFVSGALHHFITSLSPFMNGLIAATVATWFTFLPSFVFIFAGAPLVESSHHELGLKAPMTAITAAVVGVILSLSFFFGRHLLWPETGGFNIEASALTVLALVGLIHYKLPPIRIILGFALVGAVLHGGIG